MKIDVDTDILFGALAGYILIKLFPKDWKKDLAELVVKTISGAKDENSNDQS